MIHNQNLCIASLLQLTFSTFIYYAYSYVFCACRSHINFSDIHSRRVSPVRRAHFKKFNMKKRRVKKWINANYLLVGYLWPREWKKNNLGFVVNALHILCATHHPFLLHIFIWPNTLYNNSYNSFDLFHPMLGHFSFSVISNWACITWLL